MILKNWWFEKHIDGECVYGDLYGDPFYPDGTHFRTAKIYSVDRFDTEVVVHTKTTHYHLPFEFILKVNLKNS